MKRTLSRKQYALLYTGIFALFCLGVFMLFVKKGKSFVWNQDGGPQYLPYLAYTGQYIRDLFSRMLRGDFSFRMFDMTIGPGSDVSSIVRAHPLDFLSALVPVRNTETLYTCIFLLRMYLAGWTFSFFLFMWRKCSWHVLTAAFVYVFSGFTLALGPRHTFYLTAMIVFPLLLAGAEKVLRGEGCLLFVLSVFAGFTGNYYFMYMCTIGVCVYILLRFPDLYRERRVYHFGVLFLKMSGLFLLGTAMAMATLLPLAANLAASSRTAHTNAPGQQLFYENIREYYRLFLYLITPVLGMGNTAYLTMAIPVLPALGMLLASKKGTHSLLKRGVAAAALFLLFPFCSYLMSGFADSNARWTFLCAFVLAALYAVMGEKMEQPERRHTRGILLVTLLFLLFAALEWKESRKLYLLWAAAGLTAVDIYILAAGRIRSLRRIEPYVLLAVVFVSCSANAFFFYSGRFENHLSEFADRGKGFAVITDSEFTNLTRIDDASFWRADSNLVTSGKENASVLLGYRSLSMYNSTVSGAYAAGLAEQENMGLAAVHRFQGLDGHSAAEALANVKYYLTTKDGGQHVPRGFVKAEEYCTEHNDIYVNTQPLPFGYTYTRAIDRESYESLSAADKEQVMLEAVALDRVPEGISRVAAPSDPAETVQLVLPEAGENAVRTADGYRAQQRGAKISFSYERRAGYETYLRLAGLSHSGQYTTVDIDTAGLHTVLTTRGPDEKFSLNQEAYTVKLGCSEEDGPDTVTLTLSKRGAYVLEGAQIIYVPVRNLEEKLSALAGDALTDPVFEGNMITGSVHCAQDQVMVFSIPFSRGWRVLVDGQEETLLQANTSFMGVLLPKGEHTVTLRYATPGALAGRLIALAGWVLFFFMVWRNRRKSSPVPKRK